MSVTPVRLDRPPPHLDEDRAQILHELAELEAAKGELD
jgi:crotonobetainyl-CoA:carnitine CoA-transferase CaiB-like acyl-CoA transferase